MFQRLFATVACGLIISSVTLAADSTAPKRPNVLYVIADMERAFSMGCYGDENARTPALDKFAAQGLKLDACISSTPVCCPYRASLMSGQLAHHNGMLSNGCQFRPTVKCLGETFREAGYEMGYLGKWHLGRANKKSDPTYGFPAPDTEYGIYHFERDPAPTTDIALKFISEKSKGNAPWMLFVSWIWPHAPYDPPRELLKEFKKVKLPPNVPAGAPQQFAQKALPGYYGMIEGVDRQFARLLQALDEAGVADDTIVVFSSDHGDMIGSQGYKAKRWPYEESARVPFLIRYPKGIPAGRALTDPFGSPDIYPTLAGLAGVKPPANLDGVDFAELFAGKTQSAPRDYVYMEMPYAYVPWPGWRAFRTKEHMYARTSEKPWLLYDLKNDRWETNNLVGTKAAQVTEYDSRLANMMKQYGDSWSTKTDTGDVLLWLPGVQSSNRRILACHSRASKSPVPSSLWVEEKGKKLRMTTNE